MKSLFSKLFAIFRFRDYSLRTKLIISFIFLTALPMVILGTQTYLSTRSLLRDQIKADISRTANTTSIPIQDFADSQISIMKTESRASEINTYLSLAPQARSGSEDERLAIEKLKSFRKSAPSYVRYYYILDPNGKIVLATNAATIGTDYSSQDFFKYIISTHKTYVTGLVALPDETQYFLFFAVPVFSKSNDLIGIYLRAYTAQTLQAVVDGIIRSNRAPGRTTEFSYILDGTNFFVLSHTTSINMINKTYLSKNSPRIPILVEQGLIDAKKFDERFISQPETVDVLTKMEETTSFLLPSPTIKNELAESTALRIRNTDWIVVTSEPDSLITSLVQGQTRNTVIISIILVAIAAWLGFLTATFLTRPIIELTKVAQSISSGDFSKRAIIRTKDETGLLADSIYIMTDKIQQSIATLEQRVADRTKALETSAEISRRLTAILDPRELAGEVVNQIQTAFNYYYAQIYLFDAAGENLVLTAGTGEAGVAMLKRGHALPKGRGLVGRAAENNLPILVSDTSQAADWLPNELLPNTKAEAAIPISIGDKVLGVLDVQDDVTNDINPSDITLLESLASQVAISLRNAESYAVAETALQEARSLMDNAPEAIIIVDLATGLFADPNENAVKLYGLPREELVKVGPAQMSPPRQPDGSDSTEAAMARIGEAMLGGTPAFEWIHRNGQGQDFPCEIRLVRMPGEHPRVRASIADITERKGLQELTAQRARQQETINVITQKIQAATTIEEAMQVAARELGRALGNRQTLVALEPETLAETIK